MVSHPVGLWHGCGSLLTSRLEPPRQTHQKTWVDRTGCRIDSASSILSVLSTKDCI